MKAKNITFYLVATLLSSLVFFGVVELTTRTVSYFNGRGFSLSLHEYQATDRAIASIYKWHPFTGFTFAPNLEFQASHSNQKAKPVISVDEYSFLTNARNYEFKKSAGEIRIATIGGSTTANINLTYEENWPGRLGILLQEAYPHKKIKIINAGVPGFDTAQSIGNLALRVMPFNPDIVIIYHGYNDLKAIRADRKFSPDYAHIHKKPYGYHKQPGILIRWLNHSMFYVRTRNKYRDHVRIRNKYNKRAGNKKPVNQKKTAGSNKRRLVYIPPDAVRTFEQHVRSLVAIADAGGAKVVLSSFATLHDPYLDYSDNKRIKGLTEYQKAELGSLLYYTPGLELSAIFKGINQFNDILKAIAQEERAGWVDNAAYIPNDEKYFVDRVHFTTYGANLMAENFLPILRELLN